MDPRGCRSCNKRVALRSADCTWSFNSVACPNAYLYTIEYLPRTAGINYGLDKVRFMAPVKAGKRVRGKVSLRNAERINDTTVKVLYSTVVEIEGEEKPACVAESIALYLN